MLLLESWQDTVAAELKLYVSNKVYWLFPGIRFLFFIRSLADHNTGDSRAHALWFKRLLVDLMFVLAVLSGNDYRIILSF